MKQKTEKKLSKRKILYARIASENHEYIVNNIPDCFSLSAGMDFLISKLKSKELLEEIFKPLK